MKIIITKANSDHWYQIKEIKTLNDLFAIYPNLVIEPNPYDERDVEFWDGFKEKDIPKLEKIKIHVIIYNDYIEQGDKTYD